MKNTNQNSNSRLNAPVRPWYRHGLVWFVIFIPFLAVVISFFLIFTAVKNRDFVVRDNWYMDGKALKQDLSLDVRAYQQGLRASVSPVTTPRLTVNVSATSPQIPLPQKLMLNLFHATLPKHDQAVQLSQTEPGHYQGQLAAPVPEGEYHVELLYPGQWRLQRKLHLPVADGNLELVPLENMKYAKPEDVAPAPRPAG